ncbi:MAG TPA: YciI family protein [Candidatus Acidoferrum sp.]|nr:YciI family protein [Candidatus Acidoferrum sp.]
MRYMMIVKASKDSEAGVMPSQELINTMGKYNEELAKAGVLLDAAGLQASSKGARVKFTADGKKTLVDGPFTESKELVAGYWIIQVKSPEEAREWAKRAPSPHPGHECEIELRRFFEMEDFAPTEGLNKQIEMSKDVQKQKGK